MSENPSQDEIDQHIICIVKEKKPENTKQLIELVQEKFPLPDHKILNRILYLQEKEEIKFKPSHHPSPEKLVNCMHALP